ncbi:DUF1214 domain-containing protein [Aestuariivirga sp.]|jgi:hypothetical protein|uniref:DUF1214 domain-containing protein n=1 Tax=Aestuariivirga sp. TaxID=2650926 RepID=UPI0037839037
MQRFIWASTYIVGGLAAGCFSAILMIQQSADQLLSGSGAWSMRKAGLGARTDVYARSHDLLAGRLPPPPGQISEAIASSDDEGEALSPRCTYRLSSAEPLPEWWSLSAIAGRTADAALQASMHSGSVLAAADGSITITASSLPAPGNWLKLPQGPHLSFVYWALQDGRDANQPPFTLTRESCS